MFSAKPQPSVQPVPSSNGKASSSPHPPSQPPTSANGATPCNPGKPEFVIVLDGDQVLLFRKVPILVSWAPVGKYPLRFEPALFDLVRVGTSNGRAPQGG
jgi:hypothetical protein